MNELETLNRKYGTSCQSRKPDGWLDDYVTISAMLPAFTLKGKTLTNCLIPRIIIMLDLPFNNEMRLKDDQVRKNSIGIFSIYFLLFSMLSLIF